MSLRRRAVFIDRDGVLNESFVQDGVPHPPTSIHEFRLLPGVEEACDRLRALGYLLVVATNQPDVARGTMAPSDLEEIHEMLRRQLDLDSIWVCPHDDADSCLCRKPLPGLLYEAAAHHNIDLSRSYMVGDRWRDIEAGRAAGCRTLLVTNPSYEENRSTYPDVFVSGLLEAAEWISEESLTDEEAT